MAPFTGFIGPSYTLRSVSVDAQRCVNQYPEIDELGTGREHEVAALVHTPGLRKKATLGDGPIRGLWACGNGRVFAVSGNTLYEIDSSFTATNRGTLNTASGRVQMADSTLELIIVDGNSGYLLTFSTNTFAEIADSDFPSGADSVVFVDGYFVCNVPDGQRFQISGINDGNSWDALDFASKEGAADNLLAVGVSYRDLYLFGERTTEIWINTGAADFPFERRDFIEYGLAASGSLQKLGGTMMGLSRDANGQGIAGKLVGLQAQRVSAFAIEQTFRDIDLSDATAWSYQAAGHYFYCLNIPGQSTTWVLELSSGLWHERTYLNNGAEERHRAEVCCAAFGVILAGDYRDGRIYQLDDSYYYDDGQNIQRKRRSPHLSSQGKELTINELNLLMESGVGPIPPLRDGNNAPRGPQANLRISRDGGRTWGPERSVSFGQAGEYKQRAIWRRLGRSRDFVFEVAISDPVPVTMISAQIEAEVAV